MAANKDSQQKAEDNNGYNILLKEIRKAHPQQSFNTSRKQATELRQKCISNDIDTKSPLFPGIINQIKKTADKTDIRKFFQSAQEHEQKQSEPQNQSPSQNQNQSQNVVHQNQDEKSQNVDENYSVMHGAQSKKTMKELSIECEIQTAKDKINDLKALIFYNTNILNFREQIVSLLEMRNEIIVNL